METIFSEPALNSGSSRPSSIDSRSTEIDAAGAPRKLRELYRRAKLLFDLSESLVITARVNTEFECRY